LGTGKKKTRKKRDIGLNNLYKRKGCENVQQKHRVDGVAEGPTNNIETKKINPLHKTLDTFFRNTLKRFSEHPPVYLETR